MATAPLNTNTTPFQNLKTKQVAKGAVLLSPGQKARYAYHVSKGCLKSYVIAKNGKEHILQFAPEGWYITDMNSLFNNQEATIYIDAIEDTEVFLLDKTLLESAETMPNELLVKRLKTLLNNIIAANKRLIQLLSSTAEERYIDFTITYPSLVQRLPLKLIAAYLGITPEFVSRIRRKIAHK